MSKGEILLTIRNFEFIIILTSCSKILMKTSNRSLQASRLDTLKTLCEIVCRKIPGAIEEIIYFEKSI